MNLSATLQECINESSTRTQLWTSIINRLEPHSIAEIGVWEGAFSRHVLDNCPNVTRYVMIDPWRQLDQWNKPLNQAQPRMDAAYAAAMQATEAHAHKREVLRGRTVDVIDSLPDGSLDMVYVDGDHSLRGVSIDLIACYPKLAPGGWLTGDDLVRTIWQHAPAYEPTMVFPFVVYFAESQGAELYTLPYNQFLIRKPLAGERNFQFHDLAGGYGEHGVLPHIAPRRMLGLWLNHACPRLYRLLTALKRLVG
ncbi:class I SAM-dependent methyltransferase [Magnetofaba australis]|uniref:Class I SAM-dependent methyltransferase n=1 Tax=Magnetofaba australis IT-1 TaxID=1434232 RepID=A0A1Y2JYT0_9PROT|nr:class I SAM-dependent methyltransferase [Magnetofaba australis]OSM00047.1 hypothetical protein MAIT1_00458 [Magnetofaba australis IT-1]